MNVEGGAALDTQGLTYPKNPRMSLFRNGGEGVGLWEVTAETYLKRIVNSNTTQLSTDVCIAIAREKARHMYEYVSAECPTFLRVLNLITCMEIRYVFGATVICLCTTLMSRYISEAKMNAVNRL